MATKRKPSPYDCIKGSPILERGEKLVPFCCYEEKRDWTEIAKELDIITERYRSEFPKFDMREKGWNWIYTRKNAKKRVWVE